VAVKFTGFYRDSQTGLDYAPYRWYSPSQARWMTRDPLGMIDGPNVYVRCTPIKNIDVMGAACCNKSCFFCCVNEFAPEVTVVCSLICGAALACELTCLLFPPLCTACILLIGKCAACTVVGVAVVIACAVDCATGQR
jgi:RHS repeat-associated protein